MQPCNLLFANQKNTVNHFYFTVCRGCNKHTAHCHCCLRFCHCSVAAHQGLVCPGSFQPHMSEPMRKHRHGKPGLPSLSGAVPGRASSGMSLRGRRPRNCREIAERQNPCQNRVLGQGLAAEEAIPRRQSLARQESERKRCRPQKQKNQANCMEILEEDCVFPETAGCKHADFSAAGTLGMMTRWIQTNPKAPGSKSWQRYELYKGSRTILEAKENGCTLSDFRHDHTHGHLKIQPVEADGAGMAAPTRHSAARS